MGYRSVNISKEWAKGKTFAQFKKNAIIANLSPITQQKLYEESTGKKVAEDKTGA